MCPLRSSKRQTECVVFLPPFGYEANTGSFSGRKSFSLCCSGISSLLKASVPKFAFGSQVGFVKSVIVIACFFNRGVVAVGHSAFLPASFNCCFLFLNRFFSLFILCKYLNTFRPNFA